MENYGDKQTRTADICLAKAALYQLSYTPKWAILDLNQGPHPYQGCALTNWANSPFLEIFLISLFILFLRKLYEIEKEQFRKLFISTNYFPVKEVIQPHVPVRLPCYDFTPVTSLTLGASLQKG